MLTIIGDIVNPKDTVILVAPQDIEAPTKVILNCYKYKLRYVLDNDGMVLTVKDIELSDILESLKKIHH